MDESLKREFNFKMLSLKRVSAGTGSPINNKNRRNLYPYKTLIYWADVLAIVPTLGQFLLIIGSLGQSVVRFLREKEYGPIPSTWTLNVSYLKFKI